MYLYAKSCRCRWLRNGYKKEFWFSFYNMIKFYTPPSQRSLNGVKPKKMLEIAKCLNCISNRWFKPVKNRDYRAIYDCRKFLDKRITKPKFFFYKSATTSRLLRGAFLKPPALLVVADCYGSLFSFSWKKYWHSFCLSLFIVRLILIYANNMAIMYSLVSHFGFPLSN